MNIQADVLRNFVSDIFAGAGCSKDESARIAKYLVSANLVGHDSHGVVRVPRYVQSKKEGKVVADQKVAVVVDTPVLAVVDGKYGYGQTVTPQAVAIGVEKCRAMGLSMIALRNAGHIGRVGDWAELAAESGFVSVHFVNVPGSVLVAPYGGVERRISTAPFCVGVPLPGKDPVILDFATSVVAEGKVLVASRGGKKLPENAMVGPKGEINGDPHLLYGKYDNADYAPAGGRDYRQGEGAIRAFGEHKGSGLAIMCELLGGSLTGAGATEPRDRVTNGMLSFYIDPAKLEVSDFFSRDVTRYLDYIKGSKPIRPGEEILIPGEPEARNRAERSRNGIPLPDDIWATLVEVAAQLGVTPPKVQESPRARSA